MVSYTEAALAREWVVMAADGEFGKGTKSDGIYFRGNMLEVLMKEVETRWPNAKSNWSFATAGFSGGAGYASNQALLLSGDGWNVIGMFLANSGYGPYAWEKDKRTKGSKAKFQKIPIFVSAGETDNVQKPDTIKQSLENMKFAGYKSVKAEWHPGAHQMSKEHLAAALEWFVSQEK
jgi:predicted esterase